MILFHIGCKFQIGYKGDDCYYDASEIYKAFIAPSRPNVVGKGMLQAFCHEMEILSDVNFTST